MIQYKKILMTLALLLTAVTGAWAADVLNLVVSGTSATIKYDGNASNNPYYYVDGGWEQSGDRWDDDSEIRPKITTVTIDGSCKNFSGTSLSSLFSSFSGLTTINGLENLNTVGVQDMEYMFYGCSSLTSLDLSSFNTASVTTMAFMFIGCSKLTSLDLSSWNTASVEYYTAMFGDCPKLENIYVGDGWSTDAVINSSNMFADCTSLPGYDANKIDHAMARLVPEGYLNTKPSEINVEAGTTPNTWTFTQPGSDVVLTPLYAPTATWAEVETVKQLPAAAEGVIAGTDDPLIVEGIVAFAGTSTEDTQGTVMYAVTPTSVTDASELNSSDWKNTVPTAKTVADNGATVKVWYYIQGADTPDGETPTADNTFNDSEVSSLTVTVLSNKFDLTLKAANANTIDATETSKGTVSVKEGTTAVDKTKAITNGKLEAIKMGSEVKLNTKPGYKFRKVEVKKKAEKTIKIGDQNYTVLDGETWILFIIRNKLSDWSIERYDNTTWRVSKNTGSSILTLLVSTDGNNWEPLKLTSNEDPIDTDKQYTLGIVN